MKKYKKPKFKVYTTQQEILADSIDIRYTCTEWCRNWHVCRDRDKYKYCGDKRY